MEMQVDRSQDGSRDLGGCTAVVPAFYMQTADHNSKLSTSGTYHYYHLYHS